MWISRSTTCLRSANFDMLTLDHIAARVSITTTGSLGEDMRQHNGRQASDCPRRQRNVVFVDSPDDETIVLQ